MNSAKLVWTDKSLSDLARLYDFLAADNKSAAKRTASALLKAPTILINNPRLGEQLFQFEPREIRRIVAINYEIRYEIQGDIVYILRLWHTKEDR